MEKLKYWIWLGSLVKIPPRRRFELLKHYGDPAGVWFSSEAELRRLPFLTGQTLKNILDNEYRRQAEVHLRRLASLDIRIVTLYDDRYPEYLKNIPDPPVVIYVCGTLVRDEPCIAVVGSRKASPYGLGMAEKLSCELAGSGLCIISGLARGIDSKAHCGALSANGRTIAVLGCGPDQVYPDENRMLAKRIRSNGAIISEFVPGTPPLPINFPFRNRIISGISQGVLVIEAGERSGSLITAYYALDQGREVFAMPGNINSSTSRGTNRLIKEGAKIVTDVGDILEELKIPCGPGNIIQGAKGPIPTDSFTPDEKTIAVKLADGPAHIDAIASDCGLSVQTAGSVLVMLELSGFVEQLPGKYYRLAE
jgi:DNA processing protein